MRHPVLAPLFALALALALAAAALPVAGRASGFVAAPRDHRDLRLYHGEIAADRRDLNRLRARLERLNALLSARVLDTRAVGELHAKVHEEMLREGRARRLRPRPTLGASGRASPTRPPGADGPGPVRRITEEDEARVDQITEAWAALRGRVAPADVERRRELLAERVTLARFELADDLRVYRSLGGDLDAIGGEQEDEEPAAP